ncbi:diguanylate cyclase TpbB [soil metagenome]
MSRGQLPNGIAALMRRAQWRVAIFALVCASVSMAMAGLYALRDHDSRSMQLVAGSLAIAGEPALRFNDRQAMRELIEQVAITARLSEVDVTGKTGQPWLRYERPVANEADRLARRLERSWASDATSVPVGDRQEPLGRIALRSDGHTLMLYLWGAALSLVACVLATAGLVLAYSRRLAAAIVGPIGALASLTRQVRESRSFERRAERVPVREIDALADDFNSLLSELQVQQRVIEAHHAELRRANDSLRQESRHDSLTDLPNRAYLGEHLAEVILRCRGENQKAGLVFIDTDRFKEINDTLGHAAGDVLLVELSKRLRSSIRDADFVARLGGDEFVIVVSPLRDALEITHLIERIGRALDARVALPGGHSRVISVTMGVAVFPDHADTVEGLISAADEAMYEAKSVERGSVATFRPSEQAALDALRASRAGSDKPVADGAANQDSFAERTR